MEMHRKWKKEMRSIQNQMKRKRKYNLKMWKRYAINSIYRIYCEFLKIGFVFCFFFLVFYSSFILEFVSICLLVLWFIGKLHVKFWIFGFWLWFDSKWVRLVSFFFRFFCSMKEKKGMHSHGGSVNFVFSMSMHLFDRRSRGIETCVN